MSYEPTNWKDGDLVTSAKLNKIEQGIAAGGGVLIAHDEDGTLDKTWQEIYDADACIIYTFTKLDKLFDFVTRVGPTTSLDASEGYIIVTQYDEKYIAPSQDDYPIWQGSNGSDDSSTPML